MQIASLRNVSHVGVRRYCGVFGILSAFGCSFGRTPGPPCEHCGPPSCEEFSGVCACDVCPPGRHSRLVGDEVVSCPSTASCASVCCLPDMGGAGGATPGAGGAAVLGGFQQRDAATSSDADADADADAGAGGPFVGGPCGSDTCRDGQICLSLMTVSGQRNPSGGGTGQPSTESTRSCRAVPSACGSLGSCDKSCCQALCGGGNEALCSCSLTSATGSCSLGLP
jgi:hypothetical protein